MKLLPVSEYGGGHVRILLPVLFSTYMCSHRHVMLQPHAKFRRNRTIGGVVWRHLDFSR